MNPPASPSLAEITGAIATLLGACAVLLPAITALLRERREAAQKEVERKAQEEKENRERQETAKKLDVSDATSWRTIYTDALLFQKGLTQDIEKKYDELKEENQSKQRQIDEQGEELRKVQGQLQETLGKFSQAIEEVQRVNAENERLRGENERILREKAELEGLFEQEKATNAQRYISLVDGIRIIIGQLTELGIEPRWTPPDDIWHIDQTAPT